MNPIRRRAALALTVCTLAWSAPAANTPSQSKEAQAIQTAFAEYKDALLMGDGPKAADLVSAGTIVFYDSMLRHALNTPREKLARLDFLSKFIVVRVRHEFTRAQIAQMNGRDLLVVGVNNGWISKSSVANIERLVNIKVQSYEAFAAMPLLPEIQFFHFLKESGKWKFDLTSSFDLANVAMKQEIKKSGLTEEEFITRLLRMLSAKEVDERIFSAPRE